MSRHYIDCREMPSDTHCSVAISADSEAELLDAAAQHAVSVHGHADGPGLREALREHIHAGSAPEWVAPPMQRQEGGARPPA